MNKTVILAEKPSQAQAYAEAFDKSERKNGYYIVSNNQFKNAIITYGFGHLVSLQEPEEYDKDYKSWSLNNLPIIPNPFKFKVSKGKSKQFNIVKKHLDEAENIVIATDLDREGEAIARFIINLSKNNHKNIKRLWINSLVMAVVLINWRSINPAINLLLMFDILSCFIAHRERNDSVSHFYF